MDTITIQDLEVHYHIGVPDEERVQAQRLLITVAMETDTRPAAEGDDLTRTINYYEVSRRLLGLGRGRSWKLLETLADEIATLVLAEFGPATCRWRSRNSSSRKPGMCRSGSGVRPDLECPSRNATCQGPVIRQFPALGRPQASLARSHLMDTVSHGRTHRG